MLYAWLAIHWRGGSWFFTIGAAVLVRLARWAREALAESRQVARAIEAFGMRYRRLHGYLEYRLVLITARLARASRSLRHKCHTPSAIWRGGRASAEESQVDMPQSRYSGGNMELAVSSWHGRAITMSLGLCAGLMVAGVCLAVRPLPAARCHSAFSYPVVECRLCSV